MRPRTLLSVVLTMFALPALAAELPGAPREMPTPVPPAPVEAKANEDDPSICYEVRILQVPAGFWNRAGVKLDADAVLSDVQMRQLLEAVQSDRDACITQAPKITAANRQVAQFDSRETRHFATRLEAAKVKGATVLIPKNVPVELGDSLAIVGGISADGKAIHIRGRYARVRVEGAVERVPVATKITPVFEGGSQGKPIPFTQYLQAADVRTETAEKTATVPDCGTVVLGRWKETAPAARADKKAAEYEVIVLATARILRPVAEVAPMPRPIPPLVRKVYAVGDLVAPRAGLTDEQVRAAYRKNTENLLKLVTGMVRPYSWQAAGGRGSVDYFDAGRALVVRNSPEVLQEVADMLEVVRRLRPESGAVPAPASAPHAAMHPLRNVAAADVAHALNTFLTRNKCQNAVVIAEPVSNTLFVSADAELLKQLTDMVAALDKAPQQVVVRATVVEVPRGFLGEVGLADGKPGENAWKLSEREMRMLTAHIRRGKERGEIDVLSRPMLQLADGQTGCVQVGQEMGLVAAYGIQQAGGAMTAERKTHMVPLGVKLQVTPRVASDAKSLQLRAAAQFTSLARGTVKAPVTVEVPGLSYSLTQTVELPAFDTQVAESATTLRFGETLVLVTSSLQARGSFVSAVKQGGNKREMLIILTPERVK